jgi:hypothetical protein
MIVNSAGFASREFWRGYIAANLGISLPMATDIQTLRLNKFSPTTKGAQCPSCFTFNMPHHLPEHRKLTISSGIQYTCALCGTRYPVTSSPSKAA